MKTNRWNGILSDLFHPSYFAVTEDFDKPLDKFINEAIMYLGSATIVNCFVVLFGSLPNSNELGLFYRWYGTSRNLPPQTKSTFDHEDAVPYSLGRKKAINVEEAFELRHPVYAKWNTTLAACFLYHELQELGISANSKEFPDENVLAEITSLKESQRDGEYWIVDNPRAKFPTYHKDAFSTQTKFSLFCPVEIDGKLAGIVVFDASKKCTLGRHDKWFNTIANSLKLILKTAYKAYYSQLDPPPTDLLTQEEASGWDAPAWVFGPQFLLSLKTFAVSDSLSRDRRYGILYFDLNGVKLLNDSSSHAFGNEAIRAFGHWITEGFKKISRERSLLPPELCWWVVRWGGDEFVAVVGLPDEQDLRHFMNSVCLVIRKQIERGRPKFSKAITKRWRRYAKSSRRTTISSSTSAPEAIRNLINQLSAAAGCVEADLRGGTPFDWCLHDAEIIMYERKGEMKAMQPKPAKVKSASKILPTNSTDLILHYSIGIEDVIAECSLSANQ